MDTNRCLGCGKCVRGKSSCACQRVHDLSRSISSWASPSSSPLSGKRRGRDLSIIHAGTGDFPNPSTQVSGNRFSSTKTARRICSGSSYRAPNIIRPSRPVPPTITTSQPDSLTSPPLRRNLSSQELLTTISLSHSPSSDTPKRSESGASWPAISSLSSAMNRLWETRDSSLTQSERSSGSSCDLRHLPDPPTPPQSGSLQRRKSSSTNSPVSTRSSSSTLVDRGMLIPGFCPPKAKLYDLGEQSLQPLAKEVRRSPLSNRGSGFFDQSHDFAVSHSMMYSIGSQHTHYHNPYNVLERYAQYIMPGAELDTSLREYPPRCHPGTRTEILTSIRSSLQGQQAGMVWIFGPAGAGKSAIMQTLAESSQDRLFAALFLSKKDGVNDARRVIPTIAYQLAVRNEAYLSFLEERLRADPMFLEKSLKAQFHNLIVVPFAQNRVALGTELCVVYVDALEECQDERDQCKILELVHDFVADHPTIPITWIFATRQTCHFKSLFARVKWSQSSYQEYHLSINAEDACTDVRRYLAEEFSRIKSNFPEIIPTYLSWPTKDQLRRLASASGGFFSFASSVINFVDKPTGDPITRLSYILGILDGGFQLKASMSMNPFESLDMLYSQIVSEIPSDVLPKVTLLLGYHMPPIVALHHKRPFLLACNILGLERSLECTLRSLVSILAVPLPSKMHTEGLQFHHSSFGDYLLDQNRSNDYWIDLGFISTELWRCYARILLQWLENYSLDGIWLSWIQTPTPKHEIGYDLQYQMFSEASSLLTVLLPQYAHLWCPASCLMKSNAPFLLSLSPSEVLDVLQRLDYGSPNFLNNDPINILKFLKWMQDHTPIDLRSKLVLQEFRLSVVDKRRLFKALCEQKWYWGIVEHHQRFDVEVNGSGIHSIGHLDASEWITAETVLLNLESYLGDLARLLQESDPAAVTIFGTDAVNCCGLIRHRISPGMIQYHIFPYSVTDAASLGMCSLD